MAVNAVSFKKPTLPRLRGGKLGLLGAESTQMRKGAKTPGETQAKMVESILSN
jgi:hypothetical protein